MGSPSFPPTSDILNYYFLCNQAVSNPFQQVRGAGKGAGWRRAGWGLDCGSLGRLRAPGALSPVSPGKRVVWGRPLPGPPPPVFPQRLTLSQRALANIHSQLQGLEREAVPQFPSAQVGRPALPPQPRVQGEGRPVGGARGLWAGPAERGGARASPAPQEQVG